MIGKKLINTGAEAAFLPSKHFDTVTYTGNGGTQSVGGFINRGAVFVNGYITTPFDGQNIVNLNDKTEDFSISLWVNIAAYGSSNVIFSINSGAPSYQYIGLVTTSTGVNWVHYPGGANGNTVVSSVNLNEWNHFACVRENSTMKLYKNGSLVGSDPITYANTSFGTGERIVIGKRTSVGDLPLNGKVDQFRVFDKALSSSEVTTLYGETAASTSKSVTDIFNDDSGVALYQLDGNANDTGNTGTAIDSGQSVVFDGNNNWINVGSKTFTNNKVWSISAFVKWNQSPSANQYITYLGNYNVRLEGKAGQNRIVFWDGSAERVATNPVSVGIWQHIVGTYDGSNLRLYVNGVNVDTLSITTSPLSISLQERIGAANDGSGDFNGSLDEFRIYNSTLSSTDIGYIYNNTIASIPTSNLLAHYKFDGNANDETGNYNGSATSGIFYANAPAYKGQSSYNGTPTNVTYQKATDFQPDLVWIKSRSTTTSHMIIDSIRGANEIIFSNLTNAQTNSTVDFTSFNSNGFSVGSGGSVNASGGSFVAWCFKSGGSAVAGTSSEATNVTMSPNPDAGFSIVKFTSSNSTVQPPPMNYISHGLNSAPEMVIYKNIQSSQNWLVQHNGVTTNGGLVLNSTDAQNGPFTYDFFDNTSTDIGVRSNYAIGRGDNHIAYCFHSVEGYSKVGSYIGNGSSSGPIVETGFEPAFLLIKQSSASGEYWGIWDNERSPSNPRSSVLFPNNNYAELSNQSWSDIQFFENGFQPTPTVMSPTNASGQTYIYLAIAADPDVTQPVVENSFDVVTYTGNGSTQTINTDFKPDLVFVKCRSTADPSAIVDSVRGANETLFSSETHEQRNRTSVTSFDSNGFTLGNYTNTNRVNDTYVAWCWKAGDHDDNLPQINTNGTIDSVVSVNAATGFSIVKYTGNGIAGATVGHGLSSAPEMVIVKGLDNALNWIVYHTGVGSTKYIQLNTTGAEELQSNYNMFNSTAPSSTVFSLGNLANTNSNGLGYIAYCFHSVSGYQKMGSYTGVTGTKTVSGLGFQPRFLIIKRADSTGDWLMYDSIRGTGVPTKGLIANSQTTEFSDSTNTITFTSDGFEVAGNYSHLNISGGTYIYLAIV